MRSIKAPQEIVIQQDEITVFLAGAIDNGAAVEWQKHVTEQLSDCENLLLLNPRRDDWDSTWDCSIDNPQFVEQVNWELDGLEIANFILVFFPANSIAPISLLELGLITETKPYGSTIVVCEEGYHRKGNVDIVCERYNHHQCKTLAEAIDYIRRLILP